MEFHAKNHQKGSKVDWYIVHNQKWLGVYLMCNLSNTLPQKIPIFVPLTETIPEVCIDTMAIFLSYLYGYLKGWYESFEEDKT